MHCEIEMKQYQFKQYVDIYNRVIFILKKNYNKQFEFELRNIIIHRRLYYIIIAFDFNQFYHDKIIFMNTHSLKR